MNAFLCLHLYENRHTPSVVTYINCAYIVAVNPLVERPGCSLLISHPVSTTVPVTESQVDVMQQIRLAYAAVGPFGVT